MTSGKKMLKRLVNAPLDKLGLAIVRQRLEFDPISQLLLVMNRFHIKTVLDVGANVGQFAGELFKSRFTGEVISIEPLPDAHATLKLSSLSNPRWTVPEPFAAGADERMVEINVAGNSFSSSILTMLDRHVSAAPAAKTVGSIVVQQRTLDAALRTWAVKSGSMLLKIDTQGYEREVLAGATDTLKNVQVVLLEMSLQPLYLGQPLWLDLLDYMSTIGFEMWCLQPEFTDPHSGRTLQVNGIFCRTESSSLK